MRMRKQMCTMYRVDPCALQAVRDPVGENPTGETKGMDSRTESCVRRGDASCEA